MIACTPPISTLHPLLSFVPLSSLVSLYVVCVVVVPLLRHLGPYPFELPSYRSMPLVGMATPSIRGVLRVAGRLSFRFFTLRYGWVHTHWLFCTANFLQNRGDTTAEILAGLCDPSDKVGP